MAIEREEIERLAKDRDDEQAILDRNVYARLTDMLFGKEAIAGPKGFKKGTKLNDEMLDDYPRSQWWQFAVDDEKLHGRDRSAARPVRREPRRRSSSASWTRSRSCSAATNCRPA